MILYYQDAGQTVKQWFFDNAGQRIELEHVKGPNWARWLRGDCPLCLTLSDGRQFCFERMVEQ